MYILSLIMISEYSNDFRYSQDVCQAETIQELKDFLESEKLSMEEKGGVHKYFKCSGPLARYSYPPSWQSEKEIFKPVKTMEEYLEEKRKEYLEYQAAVPTVSAFKDGGNVFAGTKYYSMDLTKEVKGDGDK